jgi:hypothetical protein
MSYVLGKTNFSPRIWALQRMESFTAIPDYSNYLAYIFTQLPSEPESVRWKAGLTLKNNIRTGLSSYSPQVISYLKDVIFSKPGILSIAFA